MERRGRDSLSHRELHTRTRDPTRDRNLGSCCRRLLSRVILTHRDTDDRKDEGKPGQTNEGRERRRRDCHEIRAKRRSRATTRRGERRYLRHPNRHGVSGQVRTKGLDEKSKNDEETAFTASQHKRRAERDIHSYGHSL